MHFNPDFRSKRVRLSMNKYSLDLPSTDVRRSTGPHRRSAPEPMRSEAKNDEHLVQLWLHGKSSNTVDAYLRDLSQFLDFAETSLQNIRLEEIQDWDRYLDANYSQSTRKRKIATIKSLFSFGHKIGYFTFNIGSGVKTPKLRNQLSESILSKSEITCILNREPKLRNEALFRFMYVSGARVSEVVDLEWRFLQERPASQAGQVSLFGKGNKTRIVLLSKSAWTILQDLRLKEQEKGFGQLKDPVFRSQKGTPLSRSQIWRLVKRAAERAGINTDIRPVSPHWFRHAHASHALDGGAPTHLVKETLGHESLQTTSRYTRARPDDSSANYLDE